MATSIKLGHDLPDDERETDEKSDGDGFSESATSGRNDGNAVVNKTVRKTADIKINERGADFESFLLTEAVLKGLKRANYIRPSPIQLKAIPLGRLGIDMVVQAKSGTGKTCVFTVLALETVESSNPAAQVLIIAPAREIALQINETLTTVGHYLMEKKENEFTGVKAQKDGIKIECFIGGTVLHVDKDKSRLKKCQIVVGTPGRVWQLVNEGDLSLDAVRLFVLDEADKLMEESYQNDINTIYAHLPKGKQLVVTSATYPRQLDEFLSRYMRSPTFVKLDPSDVQLLGVKQYVLSTVSDSTGDPIASEGHDFESFLNKKVDQLNRLLSRILFSQCLIFCNFQDKVESVSQKLSANYKWPSAFMSSNLNQSQRTSVLRRLKNVQIRILVSTDVMARGIDAESVNLVVNFDVPREAETYFHRIGRAGRFGGYGAAVTVVSTSAEERSFYMLAGENGFQVKRLPSLNTAPSNLVENENYFRDLPKLDIPDLESLKRASEKRDKFKGGNTQKKFGERTLPQSKMIAGWDDYAKMMQIAGPQERWSPTEFVWDMNMEDPDLKPVQLNGTRREYTRQEMFAILKDSLPSFPPSRNSESVGVTVERDSSPSGTQSSIAGQRIDVNALFNYFKENSNKGKSDGAYFPVEMSKKGGEGELQYGDDFLSEQPLEKDPVTKIGPNQPAIRQYDRKELLEVRPKCDQKYAQMVLDWGKLMDTFDSGKKKKKKRDQRELPENEGKAAIGEKRVQLEPVAKREQPEPMMEKAKSREPVDIRKEYNEAIIQAVQSPFHQFFGDCALRLQEKAVLSRTGELSEQKPKEEKKTHDEIVQTEHTKAPVAARLNVNYNRDEMLAIWKTVADTNWSHKKREYEWIRVVKENELLVDRYYEDTWQEEKEAVYEEEYEYGREEEEDDDWDEEEEEDIRVVLEEYRQALKQYNKVMKDYQKAFRAYHKM